MPDLNERIAIRPTLEDRKLLADLTEWLGLKMSQVIRLALRRLHEEESKHRERIPSAKNARKH